MVVIGSRQTPCLLDQSGFSVPCGRFGEGLDLVKREDTSIELLSQDGKCFEPPGSVHRSTGGGMTDPVRGRQPMHRVGRAISEELLSPVSGDDQIADLRQRHQERPKKCTNTCSISSLETLFPLHDSNVSPACDKNRPKREASATAAELNRGNKSRGGAGCQSGLEVCCSCLPSVCREQRSRWTSETGGFVATRCCSC